MNRLRLRWWIRVGVSASVLAILFRFVPAGELWAALGRVPRQTLVAAVLMVISGHAASALKWRLLQDGNRTGISIRAALQAHFYGVLANLWLPGLAGGDLVRAGVIVRHSTRPAHVAVGSIVDRLVDMVSLVSLAAAGLFVAGAPTQAGERILAVASIAMLLAVPALVFGYRYVQSHSEHRRLGPLGDAARLTVQRPGRVVIAMAISAAVQIAFVLVNMSIGRALGMAAPVRAWFMAWPLAKVAALIPISAAGIGVREAALVVLMRPFGDAPGLVMAAGLLWQGTFVMAALVGCLVFSVLPGTVSSTMAYRGAALRRVATGEE